MIQKTKKMMKNIRIVILLIFIVFALVAIDPDPWHKGVAIRSVMKNSSASIAGIENPKPTATPMSREVILSMNNVPIDNVDDYYKFVSTLDINRTVQVKTNKKTYRLVTLPKYDITYLNETEKKIVEEIIQANETINGTVKIVNKTVQKEVEVPKTIQKFAGVQDLGIRVYDAPKNNIRRGLDLQGGTRVLLKPETKLSSDDMSMLLDNMKERLNVYGLSDVIVRETSDLSGNQYIMVEIAGANEEEVRELLGKQGKFEAKVGNSTVFKGGGDITYVCRTADCSGIDPQQGCGQVSQGQWVCRFRFAISLNADAAQRQADLTKNLDVVTENQEQYLSEKLYLFLDDSLVDELSIGADLKGRPTTDVAISGSGTGLSQQEATFDSLNNMKRLQTILVTGSLPVKIEIVETNNISPVLGEKFTNNIILIGIVSILSIATVIFLRFRRLKIAIPIVFAMVFEVVLLLGLAALIGWNLDLAAIAGIIVATGTGVDDQIVITDEVLKGGTADVTSGWGQKLKKAFFIIMAAYSTVVVSMIPLMFAGGGLLKGFAITTIAGVSIGVFLTRPAFASAIEILLKE